MTEITHLVTNGCSFTYGDELTDPKTQAWPALLAKKLGVPIVNLALPGTGNDCILRRTTEYLYENSTTNSKPLVIIAWSQDWRREEWFLDEYYGVRDYNNYGIIRFPNDRPNNHYEYALLENLSDEDTYRKTLQRKIAMKMLLDTFKTPYLTTIFAHSEYDPVIEKRMKERFSTMYSLINDDKYKIEDMYVLANEYPKCPGGHNGPEAQVAVADHIYNRIIELHGNVSRIDSPYLKLGDFMRYEDYVGHWFHWVDAV
jgi:hypothetical protein